MMSQRWTCAPSQSSVHTTRLVTVSVSGSATMLHRSDFLRPELPLTLNSIWSVMSSRCDRSRGVSATCCSSDDSAPSPALGSVAEFFYTGKLEVTEDTAWALLKTVDGRAESRKS